MDTWPGSVFEPLSLHKYLYCEGNPVNCWDPSGEIKLFEVIFSNTIKGWLYTAIMAVTISGSVWIASGFDDPVKWTGGVVIITFPSINLMVGLAWLYGTHDKNSKLAKPVIICEYRSKQWLYKEYRSTFSVQLPAIAYSPEILGAQSWVFAGIIIGGAGTFTLPIWFTKHVGVGIAGSAALWGFAVWVGVGAAFGRDFSFSAFRGISLPNDITGL